MAIYSGVILPVPFILAHQVFPDYFSSSFLNAVQLVRNIVVNSSTVLLGYPFSLSGGSDTSSFVFNGASFIPLDNVVIQ